MRKITYNNLVASFHFLCNYAHIFWFCFSKGNCWKLFNVFLGKFENKTILGSHQGMSTDMTMAHKHTMKYFMSSFWFHYDKQKNGDISFLIYVLYNWYNAKSSKLKSMMQMQYYLPFAVLFDTTNAKDMAIIFRSWRRLMPEWAAIISFRVYI